MNAKQKEQTIEVIKKLLEENNGIVKAEKLYPLGLTYKSIQGLVSPPDIPCGTLTSKYSC